MSFQIFWEFLFLVVVCWLWGCTSVEIDVLEVCTWLFDDVLECFYVLVEEVMTFMDVFCFLCVLVLGLDGSFCWEYVLGCKWVQICVFVEVVMVCLLEGVLLVDWCVGKGYLGCILSCVIG